MEVKKSSDSSHKGWPKGVPRSVETNRKISDTKRLRKLPAWNKGMTGEKWTYIPWHRGKTGVYSKEVLAIMSTRKKEMLEREGVERMIEQRSKQVFPRKDTKPECIIQSALKLRGIKFEKHRLFKLENGSYHRIDLFIEPNICVEIDGDYWHSIPEVAKRDLLINDNLQKQGYDVIRIWEKDVYSNTNSCVDQILKV